MIYFKVFPITCKTKIADGIQNINGLFYIINMQTPLFENFNLLFSGYGLIRISDSHR